MLSMKRLGLLAAFALVAGCGSARVVQRTQYGGVIALEGDRGKAMDAAHGEMGRHCGAGNYTIVQEGEEVIGSETEYGERTDYDEYGESTGGGSSTTNKTEWRVHYQCGGAPPAPPPAAGGGAPPPPPGY
jgi:hypothetical protein